jgi:hypothetical protein
MARSPKTVHQLLKHKPTLKLIQAEISAQQALLDQVRQHLPGDLASHCVAAQEREKQLVLHLDSPVWATRLRYTSPQLLSLLKRDKPSLRGIKVKLVLTRHTPRRKLSAPRHSDLAAAIILDSAEDTKHPQLRGALQRLSRALKRPIEQ